MTRPAVGMYLVKVEIQVPGQRKKQSVFRMIPNNLLEDTVGNTYRLQRAKEVIGDAFEEVYKETIKTQSNATKAPKGFRNGKQS